MSFNFNGWLQEKGYPTISAEMTEAIASWRQWYAGYVNGFHNYKIWNGTDFVPQKKASLQMPKFIAEDWANLLLNERVKISVDGGFQKRLDELLNDTNWYVQANQVIELAFALGTGALVEYRDKDGKSKIDQYRADMIAPISWDASGNITECAFASICTQNRVKAVYIMVHSLGEKGTYRIENYMVNQESGAAIDLPEGLEPVVETESTVPFFQIIRPNIKNNIDLDSPMGISVYGNSLHVVKTLDNIYDSLDNEFVLGRKRIIIPVSWAKMMVKRTNEKDGKTTEVGVPIFDTNDVAFYALQVDSNSKIDKPIEINMDLRIEQHKIGILTNLSILGKKVGVGCDRYTWDKDSGVRTATEVISDKSDLYQNLRKHELTLEVAIIGMVQALAILDGNAEPPKEIKVNFDDSIIQDSQTELNNAIMKIDAGILSKRTAMIQALGMTEKEADEELERIREEQKINTDQVNAFFGNEEGNNNQDEEKKKDEEENGKGDA